MYHKILADGTFTVAIICLFAAMTGWLVDDIWLASTQWTLVSIVFLLIAIYIKINTEDDKKLLKQYAKNRKGKN